MPINWSASVLLLLLESNSEVLKDFGDSTLIWNMGEGVTTGWAGISGKPNSSSRGLIIGLIGLAVVVVVLVVDLVVLNVVDLVVLVVDLVVLNVVLIGLDVGLVVLLVDL